MDNSVTDANAQFISAVGRNDISSVESLLFSVDINYQNGDGRTALHVAGMCGYSEIMRLLLTVKNIDVNIKDNKGNTPVELIVQSMR